MPPTGPASRTDLLTVPNAAAQDVAPEVTGAESLDPGSDEFGLYATFERFGARTAYTEDALNTMAPDGAASHQARTFPLRDEAGKIVPNAYVVAFEDVPFGATTDQNDVVLIVRGVEPVDVGAARVRPVAEDPAGFPDRLVFSRIGIAPGEFSSVVRQHDEAVVRIENAGGAATELTGATVSGGSRSSRRRPSPSPSALARASSCGCASPRPPAGSPPASSR